jgi:hypothetical protein
LLTDIEDFIKDAESGKRRIHYSTISLVEIRQDMLKDGRSASQFFRDMQKAFIPIEPNPNIMIMAGALRDEHATNPGDPREPKGKTRTLGTPDAIHLATCLYAKQSLGLTDIVFHTLDEGKGPTWEGKCIPLLGFERWYPEGARAKSIQDVCDLSRLKPQYPQTRMALG